MLAKVIKESQRDWDDRLPLVMAAYRASPHSATGYSPNRLFLGRETRMPLDLVMGVPMEEVNHQLNIDAFVQKAKEDAETCYELAREELKIAAERRKKAYDLRVRKADFQVGDWVWYGIHGDTSKDRQSGRKCMLGRFSLLALSNQSTMSYSDLHELKPWSSMLINLRNASETHPFRGSEIHQLPTIRQQRYLRLK